MVFQEAYGISFIRPRLSRSVCLAHLVCPVFWLNETHPINQGDQMNQYRFPQPARV